MTVRALSGLVVLNAFVLVVGCGVLWGLRGWKAWTDLLRLAGLAYLLGAAALFIVFTFELVIGIPFGVTSIVLTGSVLLVSGVLVGSWRGRPAPIAAPPGWRFPRPTILDAVFIAALVLYLEALWRSGRLQGPGPDWDAWRAWTLRAKSIYYSGHLDESIPSIGQNPSYPPGLSAMQAAAFHAMGSVDTVTLHQLNAILAIGFVAAIAGLLASRVHRMLVLPFLLVLVLMPNGLPEWGTQLMADLPMGFFLATAALLIALWLDDRESWRLTAAAVLLGGAMLTKREGILLAAIVVGAALVASWRDRRAAWSPLVVTGIAAFALALPWRIWFRAAGVASDTPESGYFGFLSDLDRVWPSFRLVVSSMFDLDYWLLVPVLGVVACGLALASGVRRVPIFALGMLGTSIAASTWVIVSNPAFGITQDYGVNPVGRLVGSPVLILVVLTPLLLARAWTGTEDGTALMAKARRVPAWRAGAAWAIILFALIGYPASMLAGTSAVRLPGGAPPFPSSDECVRTKSNDAQARLVFGYTRSFQQALALRQRARDAGFRRAEVAADGCGRVRVYLDGLPAGHATFGSTIAQAAAAGLDATIEGGAGEK